MVKRKTNQDIKKFDAPAGVPDYLAEHIEDDESLSMLKEYRVIQRCKIIQGSADAELKSLFDEGATILSPGNHLLAGVDRKTMTGESFYIAPIFFFTEYCKWSSLKDTESPTIMERSFDHASELARLCKDAKTRKEEYGDGQFEARNVEHLNFACLVYGGELKGEQVIVSFSRGEFMQGQNFCSAIMMRKVPLWSQVWELKTGFRDRGPDRKWWGFDFCAPPEDVGAFIATENVEQFKLLHYELKELFDKKLLLVDHSGENSEEAISDSSDF